LLSLEGVEARSMIESAWASLGDTIQPIYFALLLSPSKPTFTHENEYIFIRPEAVRERT
jgi:hypothetical protein